ncbi:MAG: protein translocase subunit SecD [Acidobacteriota bacterium]
MKKNLQFRIVIILIILGASIFLFYPPSDKINLGLDLKGGIHLVLQVNTQEAIEAEIRQFRDQLEVQLREENVSFKETRVTEDLGIEILGVPEDGQEVAENVLDNYTGSWSYDQSFGAGTVDFSIEMNSGYRNQLADLTVRQARETIQNRVDQYGVAEPTITTYGGGDVQDQIIVELPGVDDPSRVINLIKSTAQLGLKLVHPTQGGPYPTRETALQAFNGVLPEDYELLPYRGDETQGQTSYLLVRKAASITGRHLKNARRSQDQFTSRSEVVFFLNPDGVELFSQATRDNVGSQLAIVLDDEVVSAPNIEEEISTESARIHGNFTPEEAEDLALTLRSGALPASIRILQNRIVGPSLGLDSIRSGVQASILGMVLVVLMMLVIYRGAAVNAVICLVLNLLLLLAVLASFEATLTLPGIAGIILTIGMAIDANILIFERIKEELGLGKTVRNAVEAGFGRVFTTILDTNLTTFIAALFLFQFGTGPIRGFAVTLAAGLLANIFTATFVSRTLFSLLLRNRQVEKLSI